MKTIKTIILVLTLCVMNHFANAQIIYTNVQPDIKLSSNATQTYPLDLNNDGVTDFNLMAKLIGIEGYYFVGVSVLSLNGNSVLITSTSHAAALTSNAIIQSTSTWESGEEFLRRYHPQVYDGDWSTSKDRYLGLKFILNGQNYFGWTCLSVSVSLSQATVKIKSYAYDSTPEHAILAGDKSGARLADENSLEENNFSLTSYPNPLSNSTKISFSLAHSQKVSLKILDVSGRLVSTLTDKVFEVGKNELEWKAENVNAGIYFLQMQSAENLQTEKLIVTK